MSILKGKGGKAMKKIIKHCFRKLGFDIRRYDPFGYFEFQVTTWLKQNQIDVILDIGANRGQSVQVLRENGYQGNVISFEPLAEAHQQLIENSRKDKNWHIAPRMAIGDYDGECDINVASNSVSSSLLQMMPLHETTWASSKYINTEKTKICTLDGLIGNIIPDSYNNFFIKIDTQGYEDKVLSGMKNRLHMVKGIQVELSTAPLYSGQKLYYDIINFLVKQEFSLYAISPGFKDELTGRVLQFDGLFVR